MSCTFAFSSVLVNEFLIHSLCELESLSYFCVAVDTLSASIKGASAFGLETNKLAR